MTKRIYNFPNYTISDDGVVTNTKMEYDLSQWIGSNGYKYVDLRKDNKSTKVAVHRILAQTFIVNPETKRTVNHKDGNKLNNSLANLEWATYSENIQHAYDAGLQPYRRNLTKEAYKQLLLGPVLKGHQTLTSTAKAVEQELTQLSYHIREAAVEAGLLEEYELELVAQKTARARVSGIGRRKKITLRMLNKTTGKLLNTFSSVTEAKKYLGRKSCGPISNVLAGRAKSAYGYHWKVI